MCAFTHTKLCLSTSLPHSLQHTATHTATHTAIHTATHNLFLCFYRWHLCMLVCVYANKSVWMYVCACMYIHAFMYVCKFGVFVCMFEVCLCSCACMHACVRIRTYDKHIRTGVFKYIRTCVFKCTYTYKYIYPASSISSLSPTHLQRHRTFCTHVHMHLQIYI